eukprot:CAMPEP_0119260562 /NCGR_PEP_ID=MMETSP1329-20130426/886_1 /TAXON_ID=114041 /ORGANISM="Genus nov. species nov., Strain RCC1024" /LENGTH=114 /DNA_ID=CAMNT_0007259987 /DNA_START=287 /DNA_END=633 /DNA_ORIENTATION=+
MSGYWEPTRRRARLCASPETAGAAARYMLRTAGTDAPQVLALARIAFVGTASARARYSRRAASDRAVNGATGRSAACVSSWWAAAVGGAARGAVAGAARGGAGPRICLSNQGLW